MKFYRYEDVNYFEGLVRIHKRVLHLVRETPKGYWISANPNYKENTYSKLYRYRKRWISKTSRKRYAYPTQEEAMVSFVARKRRQVGIYQERLEQAEKAWRQGRAKLENMDGQRSDTNGRAPALRLY
ncbi:unnamed protein product [marine sediment metagenome]|uniref:Uncharacterized protein n=1 Tax=marine sediment metagenome TaxID=412755 RepID=X0SEC7_9ZZZZ